MSVIDYEKALRAGEKLYHHEIIRGHYPYLPALNDIVRNIDTFKEEKIGLMEIPIRLICGTLTKGRQESFAKNYMPILPVESEFAHKWINLFHHQENEGIRDPVKAHEFMGRFYISEGNKRVSILKYLNQPDILADITRIIPDNNDDSQELRIYYEFMKFFSCTSIYGIYFSSEGNYKKLAEIYNQDIDSKWPEEKIYELKSEFNTFSRLYGEHSDEKSLFFYGDIFMIYINLYGTSSLLNDNDSMIPNNLAKILPSHKSFLQKLKDLLQQ